MQHVPAIHIEAVDFVGRFNRMVEDMILTSKRRTLFNRTYKELSKLTNRELADIGLSRSDIADVARQGAESI